MAAQLNLGAQLKLDEGQTGTFVTVPGVTSITPPNRERASVPAGELDQDFQMRETGSEGDSEFSFNYHWDPADTEHIKWKTLLDGNTEFDVQLVTPDATPTTFEMSAKVMSFVPDDWEADTVRSATITCIRRSAITES